MTFQEAAQAFIKEYSQKMIDAGFTPSITWIDEERETAYVGSKESTPGTYGDSTKQAVYYHEQGKAHGTI